MIYIFDKGILLHKNHQEIKTMSDAEQRILEHYIANIEFDLNTKETEE